VITTTGYHILKIFDVIYLMTGQLDQRRRHGVLPEDFLDFNVRRKRAGDPR